MKMEPFHRPYTTSYWSASTNKGKRKKVKFGADIFIWSRVIGIFQKLKMAAAAILDLLGNHGTTHESTLVVRTSCKNFVMIG